MDVTGIRSMKARLVAWLLHGASSTQVILLLVLELALPPLLLMWLLRRVRLADLGAESR